MKILAVGGGSGGHVTPVVAVLRELRDSKKNVHPELRFWCDRRFGSQATSIMHQFDATIRVETILSGKLRRYHNLALWRQLLRPISIVIPNVIDSFLVMCGVVQSLIKLIMWRPDVIFTKGGYVCLPVGIAAKLLNIPLVIHDSDAHPGLTNRILAKWATAIGTGAPLKHYPYPAGKSQYVGIPINLAFRPMQEVERRALKKTLGFDEKKRLVVITGGGLGAKRINDAVATQLGDLLKFTSVMLISGRDQYDELRALLGADNDVFQLRDFVSVGMSDILGAADVVVTRAGATTILELAALAKPTVLVPNGFLTGGHQLKNARAYAEEDAVVLIDDHELSQDHSILTTCLSALVVDDLRLADLSRRLQAFAKPDAARDMAHMIIRAAKAAK